MNNDKQNSILLLLPPFYTPFTPPLGISILKAYLEQNGFAVTCFDFNTVPRLWVMHHQYFEQLRKLEGITAYHGYTNLWYVLQAHMLAHLNGVGSLGCAKVLSMVLPIYGIKPAGSVISSLIRLVGKFFRDLEEEFGVLDMQRFSVVGTSTYSTSLAASLFIHKMVKRKCAHIKTVMGGGVFADDLADGSANLETLVAEYPDVDHIVLGEGEILLRDLLEGKHAPTRLLKLSDAGQSTLNMRDVPIPDYGDFNVNDYLHLSIEGARSCPFQCSFCSETIQWGEYRKKPLGTLAKQMIYLAGRYDNRTFYMGDSLMNPYIEDLCGSLLREEAEILYDGYLRADKIATHRDRARRWARSGLVRTRLGIESASRRVLDAMAKKTSPEGISEVLKSLASAGIRTTTLWIVGFPGETEQDFRETLDFIREHHRFIYELDVHYYYYYPYGQVGSRLYQSYPLYPEEVKQAVKFQQWEIVDANPTREEKFDRLVRMNNLAVKLGIPNLHTLEQRYEAERRWQQLFPLVRDVFQSGRTSRTRVQPRSKTFAVFSEEWKRQSGAYAPGKDAVLCYRVFVKKRLDVGILAKAIEEVVWHNEMLQVDLLNGQYLAPLADTASDRANLLSLVHYSGNNNDELAALEDLLIQRATSEVRPKRTASFRVTLVTKEDETSELLLFAHRAIADSRSVILLVEDLFRIYEQLSEEREVSLRPRTLSYSAAFVSIPTEDSGAVKADGNDESRRFKLLRKPINCELEVASPIGSAAIAGGSTKCRIVRVAKGLASEAFSAALDRHSLTLADVLFGLLLVSLARVSGTDAVVVDVVCDCRYADERLRETVGPLTGLYRLRIGFSQEETLLSTIHRARQALKQVVLANRQKEEALDHSSTTTHEILIDMEYMLDAAWLGGDAWMPQGFVVSRSNYHYNSALEIVPVQNIEGIEIVFRSRDTAQAEQLVGDVESLLVRERNVFGELLDVFEEEATQISDDAKSDKLAIKRFASGKRKAIRLS